MNLSTTKKLALAALAASFSFAAIGRVEDEHKLLAFDFEPRTVRQVEVGDFHFLPGQVAPIHTHAAPAIGYVSKGTIFYQVEGQEAQLLRAGDAFYEPVGPRILHFDNASDTEEAIFTDFNLEQAGEPFIVFPKPPTAKIDRRTYPTVAVDDSNVSHVEIDARWVKGESSLSAGTNPILVYVDKAPVKIEIDGVASTIEKGKTFSIPANKAAKASAEGEGAKLILFRMSR